MTDTWIRNSIGQAEQHFATRQATKSALNSVSHIAHGTSRVPRRRFDLTGDGDEFGTERVAAGSCRGRRP